MSPRLIAALVACSLAGSPALAFAQEDLDDLMSSDPERAQEDAESSDEEEGDGLDGEGSGGDMEFESAGDDERPPGDPTAFAKPKEEEPEPVDVGPPPFSVGLLIGYGLNLEGDLNPWGVGFGVGAGYDAGLVSFGLRFVYYLGESGQEVRERFGGGVPATEEVSVNLWELGVDVGLDVDLDKVLVRPAFGLGFANGESDTNLYIAPGVALLYSVSDTIYIGLDSRYQLIMSDNSTGALIFLAALGMRI